MRKFLIALIVIAPALLMCAPADGIKSFYSTLSEQDMAKQYIHSTTKYNVPSHKVTEIVASTYIAGANYDIDPKLILSIMKTESGFKAKAKSGYGAVGLMQVVPRFHRNKLKNKSPYNVKTSIEVGTAIYRDCFQKTKSKYKALNCYSGGGGKKYYTAVMKNYREISSLVNAGTIMASNKEPNYVR